MSHKSSLTFPRFLVTALGSIGDEAVLPEGESHHLARVLRLGAGDKVVAFDGGGREFLAVVVRADRTHAVVKLFEEVQSAREPRVPFSLVQALLKGTAMDDVVRDATMLGASRIQPVISHHVVAKGTAASKAAAVERWRRIALASAKQSRRAVVPRVEASQPLLNWLRDSSDELRLMFVEPSADWSARTLRSVIDQPVPGSIALIVGPEGGWSRDEIEAAVDSGCVAVTLGDLTLRADAVPIVAAAVLRVAWE
jgi:16S rRNA (uracil1498-N3)-methyltransferase